MRSRILMFLALIALGVLFFMPMWKIILIAPQYPHGVEMHIHIDKIDGKEPGTLQNVNILNHYIGMKEIVPDAIPELRLLPKIILVYLILGVAVLIIDKGWLYWTWATLLIIGCMIGMYDFYLWEYDYGHNLSPNAPMKFEDESFQPPLLGSKVLLNFTAISLPHVGGYAAMLSILSALAAGWFKNRSHE